MSQNRKWQRGRKTEKRRNLRRILILCEDEKSSRDYFEQFPHNKDQVEIECVGTGRNTDSLMEDALTRIQAAKKAGLGYSKVWVVFDKDSFPWRNFNRALDLARKHKEIFPCWSNECFELWYLLHFNYRDTPIGRGELKKEVSKKLERKYDKADASVFDELLPKMPTALRNAGKLELENSKAGSPTQNPSTQVHLLVKSLLEFDPNHQN